MPRKRSSQKTAILKHLAANGRLTPLQALKKFGCMALSQRIGELKRDGYCIYTDTVRDKNKRYAQYYMA